MSDLIRNLRAGLRDNLKAGISDVQVSRYFLSNPTPPGIHILPPAIRYHGAMGAGLTDYTFTVQAFVALTMEIGPQILLDDLLAETGDRSILAALEADPTLGGVAEDLIVTEAMQPRILVTADNKALLTSDLMVTVYVDGST